MVNLVVDERTLGIIRGAAGMLATQEEIAGVLDVSRWQFQRFMGENPEARHAYDSGQAAAKMKLRKFQWAHAEKNHGMAIFLGKNYLGQRDIAGDGLGDQSALPPANDSRGIDKLNVEELAELERLLHKTKPDAKSGRGADAAGGEEPSGLHKVGVA